MSKKHADKEAPEPQTPYGAQTPRPRWMLALWIVLCAGWMTFLVTLVVRGRLSS